MPQARVQLLEGFGFPQPEQNLPVLTMPQEQVQLWLLSGFGCPHAEQNLPVLIVPQEQVQPWLLSGFGCPHAEQNLPVLTVPQEQVQFWLLPGFGFPQAEQNLPVLTVPQAQVQLPAAAWVFCICAALVAEAASIKLPPVCIPIFMPIKPAMAPERFEPAASMPRAMAPWT